MRRNVLLLVIALLVVLIPAEIYLRVQANQDRARIRGGMDERALCTEQSKDKRLIYTYTPGECGANSRGFRDVEHTPEKPPHTFRIVLIGDSVAEGRDVDPDSAFGRVLERMLNGASTAAAGTGAPQGGAVKYEVILLARIGYSTSQEIVLLEDEAPRYHPDLILWSYCLNDPADPVFHNANGNLGRYWYRPTLQLAGLVRAFAFRLKQKLGGRGCPTEFHAFLHCAFHKDIDRDIDRIARDARAQDVPVAFIVHPIFEDRPSFTDYSLTAVHQDLDATALGAGFTVIDVLDGFRAFAPADLKIHRDDYFDPWHLNVRGHLITAAFIRDRLVAGELLPPGHTP
ncbi:MAG TPA: SGNH/GDSL hydrolase family protein [Candidatus Krumholzibacteria bacterium]|nr:SGNH/GDSL hydrolase family protein [Candidatus Krumholzibacteria bacterium]